MARNVRTVSINLSEETAIKTLSKLSQLELDPTPDLYAVWYSYFKGDDLDLAKKVDQILEQNPKSLKPVHFISVIGTSKKEEIALNNFSEDSRTVIDNTYDKALAVSENTRQLGSFINDTSADTTKQADDIIKLIQNKTKIAMDENERLHSLIQEERAQMDALKENLEKVKTELITDALTGVHNRRHFDICLDNALKEATVVNKPLSLFIFDIDHFKNVNDTYGHQIGDLVLKFIGSTMRSVFPDNNHHLFRYGGEEFAIIFQDIAQGDALKYGTMLANAISKKEITKKSTNEKIGNITISGGITERRRNDTSTNMISRSDVALYDSKNKGRNQINFAR